MTGRLDHSKIQIINQKPSFHLPIQR